MKITTKSASIVVVTASVFAATFAFVTWRRLDKPAVAQAAESSPLKVDLSVIPAAEGWKAVWTITNTSAKDITAYTLVFEDLKNQGPYYLRTANLGLPGSNPGGESKILRAGETTQEKRGLPLTNANASILGTIDYVLFADGSDWGADSKKQSLFIKGQRLGWNQARSSLRSLLNSSGVSAVTDNLASEK